MNTTRDGINVSAGRFEDGAWSVTYTSLDLIEEAKVVVSPVDAQASRGSGQVNLVTRSGTNQIHGSVFWANHNCALDANSWFNNFNSVAKNYDNRNQYGARVGGPIINNKTFFFLLFEGQRDLKRENFAGTTLTDTARQGIFRYFPGVDTDRAHQITSNGTYELPFGTGHFLLGNAPGWVQQIVNKWQIGGIMNFYTGGPLSFPGYGRSDHQHRGRQSKYRRVTAEGCRQGRKGVQRCRLF